MASKVKTVRSHFKRRCCERLGYVLNESELVTQIQQGKLQVHSRCSNRVTRWKWTDPLSGTRCLLVYDKIRKQLITVLFEDFI